MKKTMLALSLSVLFFSCEKGRILKEYDKVSNIWMLKSATALPSEVFNTIKSIDMSLCKPKRKRIGNEGFGCNGSINDSSSEGLSVSYNISSNSKLSILRVLNITLPEQGTVVSIVPSKTETTLNNALSGQWDYTIANNTMTWKQGDKVLVFELN